MGRSSICLRILLLIAFSSAAARESRAGCDEAIHNKLLSECAFAVQAARQVEQSPDARDPWAILPMDFESESDLAGSFLAECYDLLDHPDRLPSRYRLPLKRADMAASSAGCTRTEGLWGESDDDIVETATPYIGFFMAD